MSRLFTLIAENIVIVIGFALYGVLVYYMLSKALRIFSKKRPARRGAGRAAGQMSGNSNSQNSGNASSEKTFSGIFGQMKEETAEKTGSRKDFSNNIPTANSYIHRDCQGQ